MDIDLNACTSGDGQAWDHFVSLSSGLILAAIRRTAGHQLDATGLPDIDDLLQAVYLRLVKDDFRLLKSFNPSKASMSTWLTIVTRSVTIDTLRKRRLPTVPIHDSVPSHVTQEPASSTARGEEVNFGAIAPVHLLTERQRLVLAMLLEDDMTVPDVAQILKINEQTVRSTKHKAIERLRKAMEAES